MSKAAARAGATSKQGLAQDGDICPVCKSSRYLNPNMRFLVNPACYHTMCESCVDRIYSHGPAPCAIAGCKQTLRKAKFRSQTFDDLKVEREVDIRRRVAKVFHYTQADFESLKEYNDYLEVAESTTWNLIYSIDVEITERRLRLFAEWQKAEALALNPNASRKAVGSSQLDIPQSNDNPTESRVVLKRSAGQRKGVAPTPATSTPDAFATENGESKDTGFAFIGLKKRVAPEPEKAYDPYDGWSVEPQYFILQDDYDVDWLRKQKDDPAISAGGYDIKDFYTRALCDAFSGFSVFVGEEIIARENQASGDPVIGTQNAALATAESRDVHMDDVF